ncbi:MAG TPA: Phenylacetic acid catabolic protein [Acidimicrobiales bacterium]|nr:Phenylacetic acid catabolic protein [Acidimicrobiales bacterium]
MIHAPLVVAWCDDLFLQGHQLARWITDYVDLEESLAMGSVAQEHLAHAAALLGACEMNEYERDAHVYERPADQWFPSALSFLPRQDWPATVAHALFLNQGLLVLRSHVQLPDKPRVQQLAEIIRAEQDLHARHWARWVRVFASDPELADEFGDRVAKAAGMAVDLFGFPAGVDGPDALVGDTDPADMQREWAKATTCVLEEAGITAPDLPDTPQPRQPGDTREPLTQVLAELRWARGPGGANRYEVYR